MENLVVSKSKCKRCIHPEQCRGAGSKGLRCPAALPSPVYPARNCVVCSGGHAKSPGGLLMNPGIVETHQSVSLFHWSLWNQKNNCAKWKQQKMDIK